MLQLLLILPLLLPPLPAPPQVVVECTSQGRVPPLPALEGVADLLQEGGHLPTLHSLLTLPLPPSHTEVLHAAQSRASLRAVKALWEKGRKEKAWVGAVQQYRAVR